MTIAKINNELSNLFTFENGAQVKTKDDWMRRRKECLDLIVSKEYGGLPPAPKEINCHTLYLKNTNRGLIAKRGTFRVIAQNDKTFAFTFQIIAPPSAKPCPVIITGDGCWHYAQEAITQILSRGYGLAIFNRVEIAADVKENNNPLHLHEVYAKGNYGALSAWAWGYHRVIDGLEKLGLDFIDLKKIVATGHSRGGKTALLAGATDRRIAITAPNNSGCGGAGCFKFEGEKAETLERIVTNFPHWFNPKLNDYIGKERNLPFDQHFLKASVAPNALLTTEALGDLHANPSGSWLTHKAGREVFKFLNIEEKIAIYFRNGQHKQGPDDWQTLMDFADWQFFNKPPAYEFNNNPFKDLPKAYSWEAPR